jgi:hypothetical protein
VLSSRSNLIPAFTKNLHWSIRTPARDVFATPIEFPTSFRTEDQKTYLDWVYVYSLRMEGEVLEDRFHSWLRTHPLNGYQPREWEFERGVMMKDYDIIYNPWEIVGTL